LRRLRGGRAELEVWPRERHAADGVDEFLSVRDDSVRRVDGGRVSELRLGLKGGEWSGDVV
jgi:hypothetical protein